MRYAINVSDLIDSPIATFLLPYDVIPNRIIVEAEKGKIDGAALVLECNEERAKAIIEMIRMNRKKHVFRCYKSKYSGWSRL